MSKSRNQFFEKGQKVKVDRSGSGDGVQFLTIKDIYETDNINGYRDFTFEELDDKKRVSEYYVREITESDLKMKKLFDELDIAKYEIETDDILMSFWKSQEDNIKKAVKFINSFLHPYLTEYGHSLPINKLVDWDSGYKTGMRTKSHFIFTIPHKYLNIVVIKNSTYVMLYITAPELSFRDFDDIDKAKKNILGVFFIDVEYSDDIYIKEIENLTQNIIDQYEKSLKKGSCYVRPDYKIVNKVKNFKYFMVRGDYEDYSCEIPSIYTWTIRELNYIKYYVFNKGFN